MAGLQPLTVGYHPLPYGLPQVTTWFTKFTQFTKNGPCDLLGLLARLIGLFNPTPVSCRRLSSHRQLKTPRQSCGITRFYWAPLSLGPRSPTIRDGLRILRIRHYSQHADACLLPQALQPQAIYPTPRYFSLTRSPLRICPLMRQMNNTNVISRRWFGNYSGYSVPLPAVQVRPVPPPSP